MKDSTFICYELSKYVNSSLYAQSSDRQLLAKGVLANIPKITMVNHNGENSIVRNKPIHTDAHISCPKACLTL